MLGATTSTTGTIYLYVATLNISNSDTSFKEGFVIKMELLIQGLMLLILPLLMVDSLTVVGIGVVFKQILSDSSATIGNTASAATGPFPGSGSTCTITFKEKLMSEIKLNRELFESEKDRSSFRPR